MTGGDCCSPITVYPDVFSDIASGTMDEEVTLVPSCASENAPSGCPDEIKAYAECCTDDWDGDGGGGGVSTTCCPGAPTPETLTLSIVNKSGDCSCLPDSISLSYAGSFGGVHIWSGGSSNAGCAGIPQLDWDLRCDSGAWELITSTACDQSLGSPDTATCPGDPVLYLSWVGYSFSVTGGCPTRPCTGTFDVIITE